LHAVRTASASSDGENHYLIITYMANAADKAQNIFTIESSTMDNSTDKSITGPNTDQKPVDGDNRPKDDPENAEEEITPEDEFQKSAKPSGIFF
jgi:hypothetical protein